jgi:hypothetical protein
MWLKLTGLALITLLLCIVAIPVRTHAVDLGSNEESRSTLMSMLKAMYLTPGTAAVLVLVLAFSGFAAFKISRGQW